MLGGQEVGSEGSCDSRSTQYHRPIRYGVPAQSFPFEVVSYFNYHYLPALELRGSEMP